MDNSNEPGKWIVGVFVIAIALGIAFIYKKENGNRAQHLAQNTVTHESAEKDKDIEIHDNHHENQHEIKSDSENRNPAAEEGHHEGVQAAKFKVEVPLKEKPGAVGFISNAEDEKKVLEENPETCDRTEYRGYGFKQTEVKNAEWKKTIDLFHVAKANLKEWLKKNPNHFSEKTIAALEAQIKSTRLVKPPAVEVPDLTWRGIGIWSKNDEGKNMIYVSQGFIKMLSQKPARGAFEMHRLVAQSLSPCGLEQAGVSNIWDPLLKCLEIHDSQACSPGNYSESGWAVSSSLATVLSPPGCSIPAFAQKEKNECLGKFIGMFNTTAPRKLASKEEKKAKEE